MIRYRSALDQFDRPTLAPDAGSGWIRLDKNEAPFCGLPGDWVPGNAEQLRSYPDPFDLYERLACWLDQPLERLLITFGSEQALRMSFEIMIESGDSVVYPYPTFAMIDVFAAQFGALAHRVEYDSERHLAMDDLISAVDLSTRLVVVANPNNPTGTLFDESELRRLLRRCEEVGCLLVVDEAYFHYCDITAVPLVEESANIAVTRTFSKGWGLAGIRVGYIIAQPDTIALFRRVKPIDEISTFSMIACSAALSMPQLLQRNVEQVSRWRQRFSGINSPSAEYIPSEGNFILIRLSESAVTETQDWCINRRVRMKFDLGHPSMNGIIRFSIGSDDVMEEFYDLLCAF